MKVTIPRIVRPIALSEYREEYGEQVVWMWVNPSRALKLRFYEVAEEFAKVRDRTVAQTEDGGGDAEALPPLFSRLQELGDQLYAWWAEMWSQHEDEETHWTVEEVRELATTALDYDPGFWDFLQERSLDAMQEYREQKKMR